MKNAEGLKPLFGFVFIPHICSKALGANKAQSSIMVASGP